MNKEISRIYWRDALKQKMKIIMPKGLGKYKAIDKEGNSYICT